MYLYVKIPLKNLNHSPYFPHSTNIYICRVTIVLRMYDNVSLTFIFFFFYLVFCETILYALSSLLSTHIQSPEITVLLHISIRICHPILDLCNLCQSWFSWPFWLLLKFANWCTALMVLELGIAWLVDIQRCSLIGDFRKLMNNQFDL